MCNVSSILKSILFADDTNIFLVGDDLKEVCETMSFELDKLSRWFQANKLSLNVSKTNFRIFSNKNCDDSLTISIKWYGYNESLCYKVSWGTFRLPIKLE